MTSVAVGFAQVMGSLVWVIEQPVPDGVMGASRSAAPAAQAPHLLRAAGRSTTGPQWPESCSRSRPASPGTSCPPRWSAAPECRLPPSALPARDHTADRPPRNELGDVVAVAAGELTASGAAGVDDQVMLGAGPSPVDRRVASVVPPLRARMCEPSIAHRSRPSSPRVRSRAGSCACGAGQTPPSVQSRRRRQQACGARLCLELNRPGIDGGFQPPKDGSHGGTEEVPRRVA
jgi:hypothetical protein